MDFNYITLIAVVVGFISTLLTHKYHINLHSKKLQKIENDVGVLLKTVNSIASVADPKIEPVTEDISKVYTHILKDLNSDSKPLG